MDFINYLILGVAIINTFLTLLIYLRSKHSFANFLFVIVAFTTTAWTFSMFFYRIASPSLEVVSAKLLYFFPVFIPTVTFLFSLIFPFNKEPKNIFYIVIISAFIMGLLTLIDGAVIKDVIINPNKERLIVFGWAYYYLYIFYIPLFFTATYILLLRKYFIVNALIKMQILYILLGLLTASIPALITNLLLPTMNYFEVNWVGQLFTVFWISGVAYAIIKHRLLDIRLIVARTVSFTILILFVAFIYSFLLVFLLSFFTGLNLDNKALAISAVLVLMIAFTVQYLRRGIERITDSILYKDRYDAGKLLNSLALKMASIINLDELLHQLLHIVVTEMRVSRGIFILIEKDKFHQIAYEGYKYNPEFDIRKIHRLLFDKQTLVFEELPDGELRELMRHLDFTIVVPLLYKHRSVGLIAFGEKLSGDVFSASDIQVLETLAPEAAIAIENAKAYGEINKFNSTLKDEVERATSDLKEANERLTELDRLKDDFVSVASHELRTPMTAIKSYLWMALAGQGGALNEKQTKYIQRAYSSTDRLIKLVNDMLNISKIDSGRLTIQIGSINIDRLIHEVVEELNPRSTELGINFVTEQNNNIPDVLADPDKIKEVFYNLVGNSMKFTQRDGKITISRIQKDNMVEISINDTGAGIDPSDLPKLFQKFNIIPGTYVTNQPTFGTGLGLYICKSLIELHGGKIWVKSEGRGKGTTFSFTLRVFNQEDYANFKNNTNKQ